MDKIFNIESFVPVGNFPLKIFTDQELIESIRLNKKLIPRHLQLSPTNRCNLRCSFCTCKNVNRNQELSFNELKELISICEELNVKAITLTGGGEPTLHPNLIEIMELIYAANIKLAIVSNGLNWRKIPPSLIKNLTWARISFSDERKFNETFKLNIEYICQFEVDLGFSYVLSNKPNFANIIKIFQIGTDFDFKYIRFIDDLISLKSDVFKVKKFILSKDLDDSKVIYQDRHNSSVKGSPNCYVSIVKPFIYPDGFIYPCCGTNICIKGKEGSLPEEVRMGHFRELPHIIDNQTIFDGSVCDRCDYSVYNKYLSELIKLPYLEHKDFI